MAVPLPDVADARRDLVERLKALYPEPCAHDNRGSAGRQHYCVGGALIHYLVRRHPADVLRAHGITMHRLLRGFPSRPDLARALQLANPQLGADPLRGNGPAMVYAYRIITANDGGQAQQAWELLAQALAHEDGDSL